jgi:hypothetical protein
MIFRHQYFGSQLLREAGFSGPKAHLAAMCSRKHTHLGNREQGLSLREIRANRPALEILKSETRNCPVSGVSFLGLVLKNAPIN